jgi:hypothetical protein
MVAMTTTTITAPQPAGAGEFRLVAVDLYRDIHKGIRAELFAITTAAGTVDPACPLDRTALADHITSVAGVLEAHAHHEDAFIQPALELHFPDLAEQISSDHDRLEATFARVTDLARSAVEAGPLDQRRLTHLLYLDLAGFTSQYLVHQDLEERVVMPRLESAIGNEATGALHGTIVSSIPPDELARSLAFMLPAMNLDDRTEMLSGIRMAAPPEAFAGVLGLARSVLRPTDTMALEARLEATLAEVAR